MWDPIRSDPILESAAVDQVGWDVSVRLNEGCGMRCVLRTSRTHRVEVICWYGVLNQFPASTAKVGHTPILTRFPQHFIATQVHVKM